MRQREVNIGKVCNNDCVFCSNGAVPPEERAWVPFEVVCAEIERAASDGIEAMGFLGGEPTLRKDLVEIVGRARQAGFERIALCTNGRKLRDRALLDALVQAGVTRITLSVHSHLAPLEDELCRRPNAFVQKLQAIDNILAIRDRLPHGFALNTVIHGRNVGELPALAAFFAKRGVEEIRFNLIRPEHRVVSDPAWIPRLPAVTRAIARTVRWNLGAGHLDLSFSDVPFCAYPVELLSVESLLRSLVGELRDLDTSVVVQRAGGRDEFRWKARRRDRLKAKPERCGTCGTRDLCEGIWVRYLDLYGAGDLEPLSRSFSDRVRRFLAQGVVR